MLYDKQKYVTNSLTLYRSAVHYPNLLQVIIKAIPLLLKIDLCNCDINTVKQNIFLCTFLFRELPEFVKNKLFFCQVSMSSRSKHENYLHQNLKITKQQNLVAIKISMIYNISW